MSKYKVGDKVVFTVTGMKESGQYPDYILNYNFFLWKQGIDNYAEPLTTYTEPLEAKTRRQAAEITRLLTENKRLKAENEKMGVKLDAYELYGDQHEEEYNQAFNQGADAAWELAKKCMLMTDRERETIFGSGHNALYGVLTYFDYKHAVAKVAEWEKAKEKICVGDVVRFKENNNVEFCVTDILDDSFLYGINAEGGVYSNSDIELFEKTGRHIDVDSFLKQIGEE